LSLTKPNSVVEINLDSVKQSGIN